MDSSNPSALYWLQGHLMTNHMLKLFCKCQFETEVKSWITVLDMTQSIESATKSKRVNNKRYVDIIYTSGKYIQLTEVSYFVNSMLIFQTVCTMWIQDRQERSLKLQTCLIHCYRTQSLQNTITHLLEPIKYILYFAGIQL